MTSLSNSKIWAKMQDYYNNMGPEAWEDEVVPLQISSNKKLASSYADVILSHMQDWISAHGNDNSEPFHIVEIGAGHGKLSFYILKILTENIKILGLDKKSFLYVITDISEKNLASWQNHPNFTEFLDNGTLDFALFNATTDTEINLVTSKKTISKNSLNKPIFMICNYLFDSLSHDAFQVKNHKLYEMEIDIKNKNTGTDFFKDAKYVFTPNLIDNNYYKNDPNLNKVLSHYADKFEEASIILPIGGITCSETLEKFTSAHVTMLIADKGYADDHSFGVLENPDIGFHGSISLMVNFDALYHYYNFKNGLSLLMPNKFSDFQIACFCTKSNFPMPNTKLAFNRTFGGASPQDLINLTYKEDNPNNSLTTVNEYLSLFNLSMWDPNIFCDLIDPLLEILEDTEYDIDQEQMLLYGAKQVWDFFFKLETTQDVSFSLGNLYYALDYFEKAKEFYNISIQKFGANSENLYNLALTYQMLDEIDEAKNFAKESIKLDPEYTPAADLIAEL